MTVEAKDTGSTARSPVTRSPVTRSLAAVDVTVRYGTKIVLSGVNVAVHAEQTVGLRGRSGTGKSTLVRVLALLTRPDAGRVELEGEPLKGARHAVPATVRRRIAVLFQSPRAACDPRLTLHEIIAQPLLVTEHVTKVSSAVSELADQVGLTADLLRRRPHAVSDGQLQRACLARALAQDPDYLLCDEATSMLDASTQAHLVGTIRAYQAAHGTGVLAVSHDFALLARWTDRVVDLASRDRELSPGT
jgi:peptide/nickel transport system ATP-binding protein